MHRINRLAAVALLASSFDAFAAEGEQRCESPEKGAELIACAASRVSAADTRLNAAYKQLRSAMRKRSEAETETRLQVAQRDWLKFRDSHCALEATYEGAGGSFVSAKLSHCIAGTTEERAKYLESLLPYFE